MRIKIPPASGGRGREGEESETFAGGYFLKLSNDPSWRSVKAIFIIQLPYYTILSRKGSQGNGVFFGAIPLGRRANGF
jgi:hypothetical protein